MACPTCSVPTRADQTPRIFFDGLHYRRMRKSLIVMGVTAAVSVLAVIALSNIATAFLWAGGGACLGAVSLICARSYQAEDLRTFLFILASASTAIGMLSLLPIYSSGLLLCALTASVVSGVSFLFFHKLRGVADSGNGNTDSLLTSAVKANRTWLARILLWCSIDPNQTVRFDGRELTPLQLACHLGNRQAMVKALVNYANINEIGTFPSPLSLVLEKGDLKLADYLFTRGAKCHDPNSLVTIGLRVLTIYSSLKVKATDAAIEKERAQKVSEEEIAKMIIDVEGHAQRRAMEEGTGRKVVILNDPELLSARRFLSNLSLHGPYKHSLVEALRNQ